MANKCKTNKQVTYPNPVSINAIFWDGEDLPCFDICNGDSIQPLVYDIATYVCETLDNINVSEVILCDDYIQLLGSQDKTIANLLQILLNKGCSLSQLVQELQEKVDTDSPINVDFKCLDLDLDPCTDPRNLNISNVLQIIIDNFCNLEIKFEEFKEEINESIESEIGDFINNLISSPQANRVIKDTTTEVTKYTLRGFVPPHTPLPYFGSLSYFDTSGKGSGIMEGFYICNGNNGTQDMRGFQPIGATQGAGGGSLDPIVDPVLNVVSPSANYVQGNKGGKISNYLTLNQLPQHNHTYTINDPGHFHYMFGSGQGTTSLGTNTTVNPFFSNGGNLGYSIQATNPSNTPATIGVTSTNTTGITITMGGVEGFTSVNYVDNRSPFKVCVWIQMIN